MLLLCCFLQQSLCGAHWTRNKSRFSWGNRSSFAKQIPSSQLAYIFDNYVLKVSGDIA